MGMDAFVEDENGGVIEELPDVKALVSELISVMRNQNTLCLRFIDPYGDTTFNHLQTPYLAREIREAVARTTDEDAKRHGEKLISLAKRCSEGIHIYLKFYGD